MRIDSSRLSQLLLALGRKTETTRGGKTGAGDAAQAGQVAGRDIKVLRKDIRSRLQALDPDAEGYDSAAANITIQEILRWEFGAGVLDHEEFRHITSSIAQTLMADAKMAASLQKLARELSR